MNPQQTSTTSSADLEAQRAYTLRIASDGFDFGLTVADAFVRGIRDIGYRDSCRAIDELIDNAIQAEATDILILFGYSPKSDKKPTAIAVVDNGHGMDPEMVRLSAIWGGTHRENDRTGFGRYGYGLPSSCVSQGTRFTVFSQVDGGDTHAVTLDLTEMREGKYTNANGRITMPEARADRVPAWVREHIDRHFGVGGLRHGTVVLLEQLDRLTWKTTATFEPRLLQSCGVTYRNYLRNVGIHVNGKKVEPVDPLFITPGYRFYDLDTDRALAEEPQQFDVKDSDSRKVLGTVRIRYSSMPPTFARVDKTVERGTNNPRFPILADNNGLIIMREGRQIDVVTRGKHLSVNNDDRYWGCEIDLPASLDEEMSITTSKQQVVLSERLWDMLKEQGVFQNIARLRREYDEAKSKLKAKREADAKAAKMSERAMEASKKFQTRQPADTPESRKRAEEQFGLEVARRSGESGVPADDVQRQLEAEVRERPYRVVEESMKGAPFFRVERIGPQRVLYLNTAHAFYQDVYAAPDSTIRSRASLEVLLFVIGACELDAVGERRTFYEIERSEWSQRLNAALAQLERIDSIKEARQAQDAAAEREDLEAADVA